MIYLYVKKMKHNININLHFHKYLKYLKFTFWMFAEFERKKIYYISFIYISFVLQLKSFIMCHRVLAIAAKKWWYKSILYIQIFYERSTIQST